jgi:hypothetical protein
LGVAGALAAAGAALEDDGALWEGSAELEEVVEELDVLLLVLVDEFLVLVVEGVGSGSGVQTGAGSGVHAGVQAGVVLVGLGGVQVEVGVHCLVVLGGAGAGAGAGA